MLSTLEKANFTLANLEFPGCKSFNMLSTGVLFSILSELFFKKNNNSLVAKGQWVPWTETTS